MKKHPGKHGPRSPRSESSARFSRKVELLYEDDAVVVLNKPPGLVAVPVKGLDIPSALSILAEGLEAKKQRPFVVHRIDRFTSGIILFAKTQHDREDLIQQFLSHTPVREYLAVVRGHLREEEATLVHYLRRDGMVQRLSSERDPDAARAELRYSVEQRLSDASLVRATLVTGFQNQIRVQFAAIGNPVVGDRKYSPAEASEHRIARVALHAGHLEFVHPRSGKTVSVDCAPPQDFQGLLNSLRP